MCHTGCTRDPAAAVSRCYCDVLPKTESSVVSSNRCCLVLCVLCVLEQWQETVWHTMLKWHTSIWGVGSQRIKPTTQTPSRREEGAQREPACGVYRKGQSIFGDVTGSGCSYSRQGCEVSSLPLLPLVKAYSPRTKRHNHQQSSNHCLGLEKVVLLKVVLCRTSVL